MIDVAIFGGPGGGAMVANAARRLGRTGQSIRVAGFLNDTLPTGSPLSGSTVLGPFDSWSKLSAHLTFSAPLHRAKLMQDRVRLIEGLRIPRERWTTIVDPAAMVADDATLGPGCFAGPFAVVDASARLGHNVAIWPAGQVGHDTVIEDFVFVGRAAVVNGRCRVSRGAYVGAAAVVINDLSVGRFAVIGAGAVVIADVPDHAVVAGNPARIVSRLDPADDPVAPQQ